MKKLMEEILQLVAALFGTGGAGTALVLWWRKRARRMKERRRQHGYIDIVSVYEHMNILKSEAVAQRVLILQTTNNGGIPKPGCQLFSSVLYEVWEPPLESVRKLWQNQEVDEDYCRLVKKLDEDERVTREVDQIPAGSQLGHLYHNHGVRCAHIFKIGGNDRVFYYMSVLFSKEDFPKEDTDHHFENVARGCLAAVRTLFRDADAIL